MGKFLVAGIVQREPFVKVDRIPIEYAGVTVKPDTVFMNTGGDAYNESIALKWLGNSVDFMTMIGREDGMELLNPPDCEVELVTDYVLPRLRQTPTAVVFYDSSRKQQIFGDTKIRRTSGMWRMTRICSGNAPHGRKCWWCLTLISAARSCGSGRSCASRLR